MEGIGKSFGYGGKNVVITGAASGMGYEAARLLVDMGAKVYALDIQNVANLRVAKYIKVDLSKKDSIDNAIAQLPGEIDKIFCFAGVGGLTGRLGTFTIPEFVSIHFTGQRHLIENLLPHIRGNAIVWVASIGGTGWQKRLKTLLDFVKTPSYEAANKWIEKHLEDPEIGP
jgi:NAD(P)-dependent dehydrogenase (short-subunit alcohol dehydrogenase family)